MSKEKMFRLNGDEDAMNNALQRLEELSATVKVDGDHKILDLRGEPENRIHEIIRSLRNISLRNLEEQKEPAMSQSEA